MALLKDKDREFLTKEFQSSPNPSSWSTSPRNTNAPTAR